MAAKSLLVFRPFIGIHRQARGLELRLGRHKERRRPRRVSLPEADSPQPDEAAFRIPDYVSWSITTASRALRGTRCPIEPSPKY